MEKCVVIDFDGTLIEGDIEMQFMKYLLSVDCIKWKILFLSLFTLPINLFLNLIDRPSVFKSWTLVLKEKIPLYISQFIATEARNIVLKEDVWMLLNSKNSKNMILSGSYQDLICAYLSNIGKIKVFDSVIGSTVKSNYFVVKRHPFGKSKVKYIDTTKYNIGIANEHRDHYYMDLCDEQIYVH